MVSYTRRKRRGGTRDKHTPKTPKITMGNFLKKFSALRISKSGSRNTKRSKTRSESKSRRNVVLLNLPPVSRRSERPIKWNPKLTEPLKKLKNPFVIIPTPLKRINENE